MFFERDPALLSYSAALRGESDETTASATLDVIHSFTPRSTELQNEKEAKKRLALIHQDSHPLTMCLLLKHAT